MSPIKLSRGLVYMAGSALAFAVMGMLVKMASERLPTGEIVLARLVVTLTLSWIMVKRADVSPWGKNKLGLVLRGLIAYFGLTAYYISLGHLPLADATTVQNTTPLLTALLAWWVLGEAVGWSTAFAIACGIGGVVLIVNPRGAHLDVFGLCAALSGAVLSAAAYVTVRKLSRTEHPLVIVLYYSLIATPLAIPWAAVTWVTPTPTEWLLLGLIGLTTQVVQVLLTMGLTLERAGRATSVSYLQVAFAMILQWAVFGHAPTTWTIAGAVLILTGTFVVAGASAFRSAARRPKSSEA